MRLFWERPIGRFWARADAMFLVFVGLYYWSPIKFVDRFTELVYFMKKARIFILNRESAKPKAALTFSLLFFLFSLFFRVY